MTRVTRRSSEPPRVRSSSNPPRESRLPTSKPAGPFAAVDPAIIADIGVRLGRISDTVANNVERISSIEETCVAILNTLKTIASGVLETNAIVRRLVGENEELEHAIAVLKRQRPANGSESNGS